MRIAMMGAGGVGGYYGARLAQAGHQVIFIARGAHAEAMRRDGLRIESDRGAAHLQPVNVVTDPAAAGTVDLVVVAVKLWDTEGAAQAVVPMIGTETAVISLQNGIDKDEVLAAAVGREHVIGAITYISAVISAPGVVTHTGRNQLIVLGELDGQPSARSAAIGEALAGAGIDVEVSGAIRRATWEKFVFLTAHSAVTAATREPIGRVRAHPATRALLAAAMSEVMTLAGAEGITFADGFLAGRMAFIDGLAAESRASMAQDLLRGNRLELDWLSGAVVRRAERHGLATPVHRTLYAALVLHAGGGS
jgi:2-dehydropantoate 2-reductase